MGSMKPVSPRRAARVALRVALWASLGAAPGGGAALAAPMADADNAAQVALGKEVYDKNCASCHGAHLEGQPDWQNRKADGKLPAPPHDWHGHTWRHPDGQLFAFVKNGVAAYSPPGYLTDMAPFAGVLSDAEIWAVIAYIKSSWPPEFRRYQQALTDRAEGAAK
jgi:mono/diheme cytochrome c family protein